MVARPLEAGCSKMRQQRPMMQTRLFVRSNAGQQIQRVKMFRPQFVEGMTFHHEHTRR